MYLFRHLYEIWKTYFDGMRVSNNGRISMIEVIIVFIIPCLISGYLIFKNVWISSGSVANILAITSIFIGFLINILVPFFSFIEGQEAKIPIKKEKEDYKEKQARLEALDRIKQYQILFGQVTFSILSALLSMAMLFLGSQIIPEEHHFIMFKGWHFGVVKDIWVGLVAFLFYSFSIIGMVNVLKILVSANVLIYPRLKNPKGKDSV